MDWKTAKMIGKNKNGIALITSLLVLSALTTISILAVNTTLTDLKISRNMRDIKKAFFHAEAGISHAIHILNKSPNGFDDEINTGVLGFGSSVDFAAGTYEVRVTDNNDGDPNYDADNIIVITSTGKSNAAAQTIEVMFHKLLIPAETDGALIIYEDDPSLDIHGNPSIDGRDWKVPTDFNCTGPGCNGELSGEQAVAGLYIIEELIQNLYGEGSSLTIAGDPHIQEDGNGTFTNQDWQDLADQLIPQADNTFSGGGTITGNQTLGTRDNPLISVVANKAKFTGHVRGAGILIVKDEVTFQGTFYFEGLMIIVNNDEDGDEESDYELDLGKDMAFLFGSLVITGRESSKVCIRTKAHIKYSSQALHNASNSLSRAKVISWRQQF